MKIKVKFFSILRDEIGLKEKEVQIEKEKAKIEDLLDLLDIKLEERIKNGLVLIAKNFEYSSADAPIQDGDEVAFFPPVSGG